MKHKKLMMAFEDVTEITSEPLSDIEPQITEMNEVTDEASDLAMTLEEVSGDIQCLGLIQDRLQKSIDEGEGVSEPAAEITEIAVEAIYERLGIDVSKRSMPALESFRSVSYRRIATELAVDDIKKAGVAIWEGIRKIFAYLVELIKKFKSYLFANMETLERNVSALRRKINSLTGSPTGTIKSKEVVRAFSLGGEKETVSIDNVKTIANNTNALLAVGETALVEVEMLFSNINSISQALSTVSPNPNSPVDEVAAYLGTLRKTIKDVSEDVFRKCSNLKDTETARSDAGRMRYVKGRLLNTSSLVILMDESKKSMSLPMQVIEINIKRQLDGSSEGAKLDVLDVTDLKEAVSLAEHLLSNLKHYKDNKLFKEDTSKKHLDIIDELIAVIKGTDQANTVMDLSKELNDVKLQMNGLRSLTDSSSMTIPKIAFDTIHEMCRYMKLSLDAY